MRRLIAAATLVGAGLTTQVGIAEVIHRETMPAESFSQSVDQFHHCAGKLGEIGVAATHVTVPVGCGRYQEAFLEQEPATIFIAQNQPSRAAYNLQERRSWGLALAGALSPDAAALVGYAALASSRRQRREVIRHNRLVAASPSNRRV